VLESKIETETFCGRGLVVKRLVIDYVFSWITVVLSTFCILVLSINECISHMKGVGSKI